MNEIKRWTLKQTGATLLGDKNGEWVSYSDHIAALSQRPADPAWISVSELKAIRALHVNCKVLYAQTVPIMTDGNTSFQFLPELDGRCAMCKALDATLASPVPKEKESC